MVLFWYMCIFFFFFEIFSSFFFFHQNILWIAYITYNMDIQKQPVKKPVSNLSSALASIHLTNQQINDLGRSPNHNTNSPDLGSTSSGVEDVEISNNSVNNSNGKLTLSNLDRFHSNEHTNINNNNYNIHNDYHSNHDDLISPLSGPIITAPINLPQTHRQNSNQNQPSMDFSMRSQAEEPPLDRVGLYLKNLPSEGISLFSHRVCNFVIFFFFFFIPSTKVCF